MFILLFTVELPCITVMYFCIPIISYDVISILKYVHELECTLQSAARALLENASHTAGRMQSTLLLVL